MARYDFLPGNRHDHFAKDYPDGFMGGVDIFGQEGGFGGGGTDCEVQFGTGGGGGGYTGGHGGDYGGGGGSFSKIDVLE